MKSMKLVFVAATVMGTSFARADDLAPSYGPPPPPPGAADGGVKRGEFSGKRLVVEALAGAVVGGLVGYGVYTQAGEDMGAALLGLGANFAVTPLTVWATGRAMGGNGTLGWTYLGGLCAFAGPSSTPEQAAMSLAVGSVLLPITSALMFEVSSHVRSKRLAAVANGVAITPVVDGDGIAGVKAGLAFGF